MKAKPYLLTYLAALALGIILIIFAGRTDLFKWIVIAIGILFILPGLGTLISSLIPSKDAEGNLVRKPWFPAAMGIVCLVFGVILVCLPGFFAAYIVYTLGIMLILCGLAQIVYMSVVAHAVKMNKWFYLVPWLTLLAGIAVLLMGPDGLENIAVILTGIFLICYGVNGVWGMIIGKNRMKQLGATTREKE